MTKSEKLDLIADIHEEMMQYEVHYSHLYMYENDKPGNLECEADLDEIIECLPSEREEKMNEQVHFFWMAFNKFGDTLEAGDYRAEYAWRLANDDLNTGWTDSHTCFEIEY